MNVKALLSMALALKVLSVFPEILNNLEKRLWSEADTGSKLIPPLNSNCLNTF